ncbi:hypothetical protein Goklo_013472, partial [Gossypium klotzschianum]|nr:hypothetical protein [Gossypium klotzschianum]
MCRHAWRLITPSTSHQWAVPYFSPMIHLFLTQLQEKTIGSMSYRCKSTCCYHSSCPQKVYLSSYSKFIAGKLHDKAINSLQETQVCD